MSSEPVIKAREVEQFRKFLNLHPNCPTDERERLMGALADFLKGRVPPKAKTQFYGTNAQIKNGALVDEGFNACRDIVLRGGK